MVLSFLGLLYSGVQAVGFMQNQNPRFDPLDRPRSTNQAGVSVPAKGDSSDSNLPVDPQATVIPFPQASSDSEATWVDPEATLVDADATLAEGISPVPSTGPRLANLQSSVPLLQTGDVLGGRYEILQLLGEGGMGAVYKARDRELDRFVALKLIRRELSANAAIVARFKQELLLSHQVTHKNVIRIYDLGDADGVKFITMEFVEGQDLRTLILEKKRFSPEEAAEIVQQICRALEAAHSVGVIHRDLKPQNIMRDKTGRILVMDFGMARTIEGDGMTQTGALVGTMDYMSPEQALAKDLDQRSDLFAVGLILYELLTGKMPFKAESAVASLIKRTQERAAPVSDHDGSIPPPLTNIVGKCLERDPAVRYQNATELLADLEAWQGRRAAATLKFPTSAKPWGQTVPWHWIGGIAAVLALAITGFLLRGKLSGPSTMTPTGPAVSLAILPFRNASADQSLNWLGSSVAETLSTDVGQSSHLRIVSPDRVSQILRDLQILPDTALDSATVQRLAEFSNADNIVWGRYTRFGDQIRIDATIQDMKHGHTTTLAESATENNILSAIDLLAGDIRSNLALSSSTIKELQGQSFKPSTNSLPAMHDYDDGLQLARLGNFLDAAKRFEAATKEDPQFALAYSELAKTYANLGQDDDAEHASRKAVDLSDQLPTPEKYLIQASHDQIQRDYPKAIEAYDNLAKAAPDNADVLFGLAGLYEKSSAYDKAREEYTKVLTLDPKRVDALLAIGRVEVDSGNPQKGLEYLTRAQALAVEFGNDEERAQILQVMGVAYASLDKHEDALRNLRQSLEIKRKLGLKKGIAMSLDAMAASEDVLGKPDEALRDYKEALALYQQLGDKAGTGDILNNFAQFYFDHGKYDDALKLFKESLQAEIDAGNQSNQGYVLNNIGNVYFIKADYQNARTYYEQALQLREKVKVTSNIADTLHNLGDTSGKMGQYDQAAGQYLRALDLRRTAGDKRGASLESSSMGLLFGYQGRYAAALSSEEDALKTFRELQERSLWLAEILGHYGNALAQIGRSDDAQKSLEEAMNVAREVKTPATTAEIQGYQGDNAFYRGDYPTAAALYDEALKTASHASDSDLILVSKFNVAKIAVRQGRFPSAASLLSKLSEESDSLGLKYVSVECSIYHAEALMNLKSYEPARRELEGALSKSEKLGLKALLAQSHYLLARDLELAGKAADAPEHYKQARKILDEIQKDAKTDSIVKRSDLSPIYAHPTS
ncbi:MAG TPA: tetratricopeptide repeat protein [Candidatus Eremiobacteraceae bacterium]|nr:tetratricopeptide repeat protein [Candidatus Eremiobacteraceae bacterium]